MREPKGVFARNRPKSGSAPKVGSHHSGSLISQTAYYAPRKGVLVVKARHTLLLSSGSRERKEGGFSSPPQAHTRSWLVNSFTAVQVCSDVVSRKGRRWLRLPFYDVGGPRVARRSRHSHESARDGALCDAARIALLLGHSDSSFLGSRWGKLASIAPRVRAGSSVTHETVMVCNRNKCRNQH